MQLRLHKAAPVVAALLLSEDATQALVHANGLVALRQACTRLLPMPGVLARRDHRYRLPLSDGVPAASCVVGTIRADAFDALIGRNLCQQLRYSRRYSAPCLLRLHSPSPRNLTPVLSTSSCSADLVRW